MPIPKPSPASVVKVKTPGRPPAAYDVRIGAGILHTAADGLLTSPGGGASALVIIDSHLGNALIEPLLRVLDRQKVRWGVCVVSATEADKSLATAERALAEAGRLRLGREDLIITIGGGIVCDVGGFVASIFKRGIRVVQCPTTLLAMVDAAVGGKTAVNLPVPPGPDESDSSKPRLVKNLIGVFHQPTRVVCDVASLATLPVRELRCGLAECLKHGLISGGLKDASLLKWTARHLSAILALESKVVIELVARNVSLKARVVGLDPFEESSSTTSGRMILNLGHTFAHALETLPGLSWENSQGQLQLGPLKHGEAVGLGLLAAARVSETIRLVKAGFAEEVQDLLLQAGLPTGVRGLPAPEAIVERMLDDKKTASGRLRLVLPRVGARCRIVTEPAREAVLNAIQALHL